jgi:HEAT repeat protein
MEVVVALLNYSTSVGGISTVISNYLKKIKTVPRLLDALADKDVEKRKKAMDGLVKLGFDKKALPSRKEILNHIYEVNNALYSITRPREYW